MLVRFAERVSSARPINIVATALMFVVLLVAATLPRTARAQQISFQSLTQVDGLTNLGLHCLQRDVSGYILACTEHGLYIYDGRRFFNLGPSQGLPDGEIIYDLAFMDRGQIALLYSNHVWVSQTSLSLSHSPQTLSFRPATSQIGPIFHHHDRQITPWNGGAALIARGGLYFLDPGSSRRPPVIRNLAGLLRQSDDLNHNVSTLFGWGKTLWLGLADGRICGLDLTSRRCYGPRDGLPSAAWTGFLPDGSGHLLARSLSLLATIDPKKQTVEVEPIPDQSGGEYPNYARDLFLARTPSGDLLTQSAEGLIIRNKSRWKSVTGVNGLPPVPLVAAVFDHEANLWMAAVGRGVLKVLGYGVWENWGKPDGLPSDYIWQIARQSNGPLWVATDRGVDAIGGPEVSRIAHHHYDTPSYALAAGSFDHIWRSVAPSGVSCISASTGKVENFALPPVNVILHGSGNRLWFISEDGIYFLDDIFANPSSPNRVAGTAGPIAGAAVAADGSLWMLAQGQLLHRHIDGSITLVQRQWEQSGFDPQSIALGERGEIWIGGAGAGLYRLHVSNDRVLTMSRVVHPNIVSNTILSLLFDKRGWLWMGTDNGISVFDGKRWVSADTGSGLVWNDLDQDSIFEDDQGSIWFGTSRGLSHLLNPSKLFEPQILQPVITSISLGDNPLSERAVPYSQEPLYLQFGALNARSTVRFHYRLIGVDKSWADTAAGDARYPFLPPGHHRFVVIAYDPLTHQSSPPAFALLRMKKPWWYWWPIEALYAMVGLAAIYGTWRLRFRYLLRQQSILHHEVELRTMEMRAAQAEIIQQATQDSLTKLFTRGEIQKRLVEALARGSPCASLTIGLLDIDYFKRINDRFGHIAGDEVLKEMGLRLRTALRRKEFAGRYGGEELLVVINDPEALAANRIQELKLAACGEAFLVEDESIYVTCSIGVARSQMHDDWKSLVGRADKALYQAKAQGRDRIIEAEDATSGD